MTCKVVNIVISTFWY